MWKHSDQEGELVINIWNCGMCRFR